MNLDFIAEQGNKYELASGINKVKQDVTAETKEFLERQMEAKDRMEISPIDQKKCNLKTSPTTRSWELLSFE